MPTVWLKPLLAIACIAALVGGVAWWSARPEPAPPPRPREEVARAQARDALQAIAEDSARLMPGEFRGVWIGMDREALLRARRGARPVTRGGVSAFEEDTPDGAQVIWRMSPTAAVLTQAQFLSRLDNADQMLPHFAAMRARYGEPTGFWDCPESPDVAPIRRITWRGEHATVMEAVLVYRGGVSLTLVVAATDDVARALRRSACHPVTRETAAAWPVARELRGEQIPIVRAR